MSAEPIVESLVLLHTIELVVYTLAAWLFGLYVGRKLGRQEERRRRHNVRPFRVYKTPKTVQGSSLPKMKQPTNYVVRRNHAR